MILCPWDSPGKNTGVGCHVEKANNVSVLLWKRFWSSRPPAVPSPYFDNYWTTGTGGKTGVRWLDSSCWEGHCFSSKYTKRTINWIKNDRDRYSTKKPATWKNAFSNLRLAVLMGTLTIMKTARRLSYLKVDYLIKFKTCLKVKFYLTESRNK